MNTTTAISNGRIFALNGGVTLDTNPIGFSAGSVWNGSVDNRWSGANWSPDTTGSSSSTLLSGADVVFSLTSGFAPAHQDTNLDFDATIASLTVNDPAAVTITGVGTLSITGSGITVNNGAGLTTINSNLLLSGSPQVTVNSADGLTINGIVDGAAGLIKQGIGQLTLTGNNTYTGGTTVLAGILTVGTDNNLGNAIDPTGTITLQGGTLQTSSANFTTGRTVILNPAGTPNVLAAADPSLNDTAFFNGQVTGAGMLTIGDPNSFRYTVVLTNTTNDYAGGTTVTDHATLQINNDQELGLASTQVTLNGGILDTTADLTVNRPIFLVPNPILILGEPVFSTLAAETDTTATYPNIISGTGGLSITGGGTVVLSGSNTYQGGTTINRAFLSVSDDHNLGEAGDPININGGTLLTTAPQFSSPRPIFLLNNEGQDTIAAIGGTTGTYSGVISGDQFGNLQIGADNPVFGQPDYGGKVIFTNPNNSYLGNTTITSGATLSVDADSELGGNPAGTITFRNGELLTTGAAFQSARTISLRNETDILPLPQARPRPTQVTLPATESS